MAQDEDGRTLTRLLQQMRLGDRGAEDEFFVLVNQELRRVARIMLRNATTGTLQPTAVVNEMFLRLFRRDGQPLDLRNRRYFFTAAADQMQKIIVDHRREKSARKRGGGFRRHPLAPAIEKLVHDFEATHQCDILAFREALEKLRSERPRQYDVIVLSIYCGLNNEEIAELLAVSRATVQRDMRLARARLVADLREET